MTYTTDDIAIAAALRQFGHPLKHITVVGKRAHFHFDESVEPEAIKIQLGEKLVDALRFHNEVRRLSGLARTMIYRD